jgi:hypothetical protein
LALSLLLKQLRLIEFEPVLVAQHITIDELPSIPIKLLSAVVPVGVAARLLKAATEQQAALASYKH